MESIDDLYAQQIRPLPAESRLRLLALIAGDLASGDSSAASDTCSLLELEGLGSEVWQGVNADKYVATLREEWTERR